MIAQENEYLSSSVESAYLSNNNQNIIKVARERLNGVRHVLLGENTLTLEALAAQDCADIQTDLATKAELTAVYESAFMAAILANNGSVLAAREEALNAVKTFADYLSKDIPVNYTPSQVSLYKAAYLNAFIKDISNGKILKKARNAGRAAGNNAVNQVLLNQLPRTDSTPSAETAVGM